MVGADAGEIVQGFAVAMKAGATKARVRQHHRHPPDGGRGVRDDARGDAALTRLSRSALRPAHGICTMAACPTCRPSSPRPLHRSRRRAGPGAAPSTTRRWRICATRCSASWPARRCRAACAPATPSCASTPTPCRARRRPARLAGLRYGFVAGPGRYETTLTRPDLFARYYLEQFRLLLQNHGVELEVGTSTQPIPIHFSFAENDHIEGTLSAERRTLMRDVFDLPDLAAMDDGIANGTYEAAAGRAAAAVAVHRARASTIRCTACATTPAPRPSGSRTSCCSPTTSSTSTSSCGWATRRWPTRTASTSPSSSRATW